MDNYNTCPFVIIRSTTNAVIPRTPFYGLEPSTLPPLPQGAHENEGFHLKMLLSRKNVLFLMRNRNCSNVAPNHSVRKTPLNNLLPLADWMHHLVHIFWTIILKLAAGSASKATPLGVPAPLSLFLYLKERWWVGGGQVWGKANSEGLNTQSKHYPMFELHTFCLTVPPHTRALPSEFYSC